MVDLVAIFRAGFVRRWHTNPDLAHTVDRIDGHSARVARIILAMHPDPSLDLIRAALTHDDGESVVGDVPATAKNNGILADLWLQEASALADIWGVSANAPMPPNDILWLKFADRLDAYMWAAHHAPHVMGRDGWPEAWEWLWATAGDLGVRWALGGLVDDRRARHAA